MNVERYDWHFAATCLMKANKTMDDLIRTAALQISTSSQDLLNIKGCYSLSHKVQSQTCPVSKPGTLAEALLLWSVR
jgi:hypothetical protein